MLYAQGNNVAGSLAHGGPSVVRSWRPLGERVLQVPSISGDDGSDAASRRSSDANPRKRSRDRNTEVLWHDWTATLLRLPGPGGATCCAFAVGDDGFVRAYVSVEGLATRRAWGDGGAEWGGGGTEGGGAGGQAGTRPTIPSVTNPAEAAESGKTEHRVIGTDRPLGVLCAREFRVPCLADRGAGAAEGGGRGGDCEGSSGSSKDGGRNSGDGGRGGSPDATTWSGMTCRTAGPWDDVGITELGVLAWRRCAGAATGVKGPAGAGADSGADPRSGAEADPARDRGLFLFASLDALLALSSGSSPTDLAESRSMAKVNTSNPAVPAPPTPVHLAHPLLTPAVNVRLYTAPASALLVVSYPSDEPRPRTTSPRDLYNNSDDNDNSNTFSGRTHALLLTFDRRTASPTLRVLDELEGLGITRAATGGDAFGVVTAAGEAYLVDPQQESVERVELGTDSMDEDGDEVTEDEDEDEDEDEVQDIALGDGFAAVLCNGKVYARGDNTFAQLGDVGPRLEQWTAIAVPGKVSRVYAGRFSLIVDVDG